MRFIYNFLIKSITLVLLPFLPFMLLFKKIRVGLKTRLGWLSKKQKQQLAKVPEPRIWFHAASLGELSVVAPIIKDIKDRQPQYGIILTTTTLTGLKQAPIKIPEASMHLMAPLDYPGAVKRVMKLIRPSLLVVAETEIWPNLILTAHKFGSQLALVNGRLSEKSMKGYKWFKSLFNQTLEKFELLTVQSPEDAERFKRLGANEQRIKIIDNVKFDDNKKAPQRELKQQLRLASDQPVWVAGSTRPGEEELVISAFQKVRHVIPRAVLILAPRHLERMNEVSKLLTSQKLIYTYRTKVAQKTDLFSVILLDTMGELAEMYGVGQVAFVGGTLKPFGGHNPLEPAALAVPVILGKYSDHFQNTTELLVRSKGAVQVETAAELAERVIFLLEHPKAAEAMGKCALQAVKKAQGSAGKTVELLQKLMLIKKWAAEVRSWRDDSLSKSNYSQQKDNYPEEWSL